MSFETFDLDSAINIYALYIANDISTQRGEIHHKICELLGVDKDDFRPFESADIIKAPTQEEAKQLILDDIGRLKTEGKIKGGEL